MIVYTNIVLQIDASYFIISYIICSQVMCAFCLRRFWSAEDLRRHMRTHTGERPFSCDICRRKFTLKHSMLRHRKKHNKMSNSEENFNSDDEAPLSHNFLNNNNSIINIPVNFWTERDQESSDLISNLLGINDKTIIDKMLLSKSAEDAARLLGVQKWSRGETTLLCCGLRIWCRINTQVYIWVSNLRTE